MEKDATEGEGRLSVRNQPHLSAESSLVVLAKMFKSFMQLHIERDRRQVDEGHNPGAGVECFDPECYARNCAEA